MCDVTSPNQLLLGCFSREWPPLTMSLAPKPQESYWEPKDCTIKLGYFPYIVMTKIYKTMYLEREKRLLVLFVHILWSCGFVGCSYCDPLCWLISYLVLALLLLWWLSPCGVYFVVHHPKCIYFMKGPLDHLLLWFYYKTFGLFILWFYYKTIGPFTFWPFTPFSLWLYYKGLLYGFMNKDHLFSYCLFWTILFYPKSTST